jgi:hypothetical protein
MPKKKWETSGRRNQSCLQKGEDLWLPEVLCCMRLRVPEALLMDAFSET